MPRILLLLFVLVSVTAVAQKNLKESVAFEKPPVIDGNVSDWSTDWWLDPDGQFFCNVGNDAENLYVRLKVGDDLTQQKIALFGLSLKLNPSGKKKGKVGLKYPVGRDESEFKKKQPTESDNSLKKDKVQVKREMLGEVEVVELIGLSKQNIVSSRLGLANGIEAMIIAQDDGAYTYEVKIPFKAFRINKSEVSLLGVEFETGRFIPKTKSSNANTGYSPSYGPGGYRQPYYGNMGGNYQYNAFSTPGYFFVPVKLK